MKKILIFSLAYYPRFVGGAEVAIKEITDRISPEDIAFHLICLRFDSELPREEKIGNVYVHRVGFGKKGATPTLSYGLTWYIDKMLFVPMAAWKGLRLNRTQHFDGLWAMMTYMVLPVVLMRLCGARIPYVLTLQEGDPFEYVFRRLSMRPFLFLLRRGFRQAAVIQVISAYLGKWAEALKYQGPIEIIPNGVDAKRFAGERIPHTGVVLITTSRLVHKNAIDDIIRALALLPTEVRLRSLGTGPSEEKLKALAQELGVAERVSFEGYVEQSKLPAALHASDIFVRPSRSEGMGNSFIEAMAAGLPVVATQEGGIADFLFDAKRNPDAPTTGWAVDKDTPAQIAAAVKKIMGNPQEAQMVIHTAQALAAEQYEWNLIARNMRERVFSRLFV